MRVFFIRFKFQSLPLQDKCICGHHVGSNTKEALSHSNKEKSVVQVATWHAEDHITAFL